MTLKIKKNLHVRINARLATSFLASILLLNATVAQQESSPSYKVQAVPPNPDVADLGKFGNIPVNKYNGTANISIPLHTVELDGMKIPLALQYNTSGIRVNQEASWIGLGWNLSEGMSITREVNGFEDIRNNGTDGTGWIFTDYPDLYNSPQTSFTLNSPELYSIHQQYSQGTPLDFEPDIFTVTLPSGSCRFYLPKIQNGATELTAVVLDEKGYKVLYDVPNFTFEVTDRFGFVFNFDTKEVSTGFSGTQSATSKWLSLQKVEIATPSTKELITSWKVTKITSPNARELDFTYQEGFYFSYPTYTYSQAVSTQSGNTSYTPAENESTISTPGMLASLNAFRVQYLKKIDGDFGSIDFILGTRKDQFTKSDKERLSQSNPSTWNPLGIGNTTYTGRKLTGINVKDQSDNIVKTLSLTQGYFNDQEENNADDVSYLRLKLDGVTIGDQDYQFTYHQEDQLPIKSSNSLDFWGFYNGITNTHTIPSMNRWFLVHRGATYNDDTFERFYKKNGANRKSDFTYGKNGILTKVTYPTGGYTEIEYEGNSVTLQKNYYTPDIFLSTGQLRSSGLDNSADYNFRYQYLKLASDPNYSFYDFPTSRDICETPSTSVSENVQFTVSDDSFCSGQTYNVEVSIQIDCQTGCGQASPTGNAVWIENTANSQKTVLYSYSSSSTDNYTNTYYVMLAPGNYKVKKANWTHWTGSNTVVWTSTITTASKFDNVSYTENLYQVIHEEFEVGGARVSSLKNYAGVGQLANRTNYDYDALNPNSDSTSTGKLMDDLVFSSSLGGLLEYSPELTLASHKLSSSNRVRGNPSAQGSHIGYSQVVEEQVNTSNVTTGKVVTTYKNQVNEYLKRNVGITPGQLTWTSGIGQPNQMYDLSLYSYYYVNYDEVYFLDAKPKTYDYINGQVEQQAVYHQNGTILEQQSNVYQEYSVAPTISVQAPGTSYTNYGSHNFHFPKMLYFSNSFLVNYPFRKMRLEDYYGHIFSRIGSTTTTSHLNGQSVSRTTNYSYDNTLNLTSKMTSELSTGNVSTTKYYYPNDLSGLPYMSNLISANRIGNRIKTESFEGPPGTPEQTELFTEETSYNSFGSLILPDEVVTNRGSSGTNYQRITYDEYDARGNIMQYTSSAGVPTTILWSYDRMYPIAKVDGATLSEVATALGVSVSSLKLITNLSTISNIRSVLTKALITTYTYQPLVGVETVTDPNGRTTSYEYDSENRLLLIRDHNNDILKQYEYNYGN